MSENIAWIITFVLSIIIIYVFIHLMSIKRAKDNYRSGLSFLDLDRLDKALDCFDKSIVIRPNNPQAYLARGKTNLKLEEIEDAVSDWSRVVELAPGSEEANEALKELDGLDKWMKLREEKRVI
ncbi:MAG: tetratricopeptide repeat protein [Candidatus Eremiobacteraeota bacterium]|nr:tetratricopeptide repeat protein [Candidatus Eremiobacteraeota bacterium]